MFVCSEVYALNKLDIYRFTQLNQKARASLQDMQTKVGKNNILWR